MQCIVRPRIVAAPRAAVCRGHWHSPMREDITLPLPRQIHHHQTSTVRLVTARIFKTRLFQHSRLGHAKISKRRPLIEPSPLAQMALCLAQAAQWMGCFGSEALVILNHKVRGCIVVN